MNLSKKIKELTIENEDYILTFDMKSILVYKELSGKTFTKGVEGLFQADDEECIYFMASMLRRKDNPGEPLAEKVINGNVLDLLINLKLEVIDFVLDSLPTDDKNSKKK